MPVLFVDVVSTKINGSSGYFQFKFKAFFWPVSHLWVFNGPLILIHQQPWTVQLKLSSKQNPSKLLQDLNTNV